MSVHLELDISWKWYLQLACYHDWASVLNSQNTLNMYRTYVCESIQLIYNRMLESWKKIIDLYRQISDLFDVSKLFTSYFVNSYKIVCVFICRQYKKILGKGNKVCCQLLPLNKMSCYTEIKAYIYGVLERLCVHFNKLFKVLARCESEMK